MSTPRIFQVATSARGFSPARKVIGRYVDLGNNRVGFVEEAEDRRTANGNLFAMATVFIIPRKTDVGECRFICAGNDLTIIRTQS